MLAAMLCVFTPAIFLHTLAIHRAEGTPFFQIAFDCGCGTGVEIIWIKLSKNVGLFLLAVAVMFSRSQRCSLAMLWGCRPRPGEKAG